MFFGKTGQTLSRCFSHSSKQYNSGVGSSKSVINSVIKSKIDLKNAQLKSRTNYNQSPRIDPTKDQTISDIPFDELTEKISKKEVNIDDYQYQKIKQNQIRTDLTDHHKKILTENLNEIKGSAINPNEIDLPWDFNKDINQGQPEKNLKTIVPVEKLLTYPQVSLLMKKFIIALSEYDILTLEEICESKFLKNLKTKLSLLHDKGYELQQVNYKPSIMDIDIYNIESQFVVDVFQNRRKNKQMKHYHFYEEEVEGDLQIWQTC